MGRPRSFDTAGVVRRARDVFAAHGYHATSVDDLLSATSLQRASLYHAFGSKRGLFLAALVDDVPLEDLSMLLVALMDLSATDAEIRELVRTRVRSLGADAAADLGRALLARGGADPAITDRAVTEKKE